MNSTFSPQLHSTRITKPTIKIDEIFNCIKVVISLHAKNSSPTAEFSFSTNDSE